MPDLSSGFLEVSERIKGALGIKDDAELAARLGMTKTAFQNRKSRGSLPREKIDALLENEGLSPEYAYSGKGRQYLESEDFTWRDGVANRVAQVLELETCRNALIACGYAQGDLDQWRSKKTPANVDLLYDLRRRVLIDLNWLVAGDQVEKLEENEKTVLNLYRNATAATKNAVLLRLVKDSSKAKPKV